MSDPIKDSSLDDLVEELGEICHTHYQGCAVNAATDEWEYAYDTEIIYILNSPESKAKLQEWATQQRISELEDLQGKWIQTEDGAPVISQEHVLDRIEALRKGLK